MISPEVSRRHREGDGRRKLSIHGRRRFLVAISLSPASDPLQHLDEFIPRRLHDEGPPVDDLLPVYGERLDPNAFIEGVAAENLTQAGIADHYGQPRLDQKDVGLIN